MDLHPIDAWHQIVEASDLSGLDSLLADDAVFHSPVVHTPQRGKALTKAYLSGAFHVLSEGGFHYVREIRGGSDAVLEFELVLDDIEVNGVDIIRWNDAGQIVDFKVMIRPLKAINLVHGRMAAVLASRANSGS